MVEDPLKKYSWLKHMQTFFLVHCQGYQYMMIKYQTPFHFHEMQLIAWLLLVTNNLLHPNLLKVDEQSQNLNEIISFEYSHK